MVVRTPSCDRFQDSIAGLKHFIRQTPRCSEQKQAVVSRFKPLPQLGMRHRAFGLSGRCGHHEQSLIWIQPHQFRSHIREVVSNGDQPEGLLPVRIGDTSIAAHPVIHDLPYQCLLIDKRRNDIDACYVEGFTRSGQIVNV